MKAKSVYLLIGLVIMVVSGIGSRVFHTGFSWFDKYLGDALYAVMFYLMLSLLWLSGRALYKACTVMVFMTVIETFQLTQIPLQLSQSTNMVLRIMAVLLGTEFSWIDMLAYVLGITAIFLIDQFVLGKVLSAAKN